MSILSTKNIIINVFVMMDVHYIMESVDQLSPVLLVPFGIRKSLNVFVQKTENI